MSDDVKGAVERLKYIAAQFALVAVGKPPFEVRTEDLRALLAHIDAEPERLAAAVAREREEQREADVRACPTCKGEGFTMRVRECPFCDDSTHDHECPIDEVKVYCACGAARLRATPLTATPLKDELESMRKHMSFIIQNCQDYMAQVETLRARVKELEAQAPEAARYWKCEYDAEYARRVAVEDLSRTTCDRYLTDVGPTEHVLCCDKESSKRVVRMVEEVVDLKAERDALKAQLAEAVEVVRKVTEALEGSFPGDESVGWPEFPEVSMTQAWTRRIEARAFLAKVKP